MNKIAEFVKTQRKAAGLTQEQFAMRSGLGLRFVRELEQGKTTVRMDKVNVALAMFGMEAVPGRWSMSEIFRTAYVYVRKIPEGWLLGAVSRNWKIDTKDRFGLLLVACKDAIGNVSVRGEKNVCNGRFLSD